MMQTDPFSVTLKTPLETARGTIETRDGFLIRVEYDGTDGLGEATPLIGWTESKQECEKALSESKEIANALDWGVALGKVDAPAARHGLSLAFADARARAANMPLYRSLGGATEQTRVPVNGTVGAEASPPNTAERAATLVDNGFDCLKVKVGLNGVEEDIERIRAVRNRVGDGITLRVDANGAWTETEATTAIDAFAVLDITYVEQPLPTGSLEAMRSLRGRGVDIAVDESLVAHDIDTIIDADAADVAVLKPMVLGGPDLALAAARRCREAGLEPIISTTIDAVVARTAAVHVAAAIPGVQPCGLATADWLATDLAPDPAPITAGRIQVPQGDGLGLEVRP